MNTEEKNNLKETNKDEPIQNEPKSKFKAKLVAFLKNNKAATVLSVLLLVVLIWFSIKIRINEKNFNNEKTQLITQYENQIDSLQIKHLEFATEVFSWSVRSELLRNNTENLNQLLSVFVRRSGADLVQLVNPKDNIVLLSSDKKFEGTFLETTAFSNLTSTKVYTKKNSVKIVSPVMGFNDIIGVLIVVLNK